MLNVNKHEIEGGVQVELIGAIEENVNFEELIGAFQGTLFIKCRGVTRINSVGVKTWMRYFQALKAQGKVFKFLEISHPIIEQFNMISNFACGGETLSVCLPFSCGVCQKEFIALSSTADLKANALKVPDAKCEKPNCGAQFDDDPEEYLYFLQE